MHRQHVNRQTGHVSAAADPNRTFVKMKVRKGTSIRLTSPINRRSNASRNRGRKDVVRRSGFKNSAHKLVTQQACRRKQRGRPLHPNEPAALELHTNVTYTSVIWTAAAAWHCAGPSSRPRPLTPEALAARMMDGRAIMKTN